MSTTVYTAEIRRHALTGEDIRRARETAGISQIELASWLSVARQTVKRLEDGEKTRPDLPDRALEAIKIRGPVLKNTSPKREVKSAHCPPDWLVQMLVLSEDAPPENETVREFIDSVRALLGIAVGGPSLTTHLNTTKLFDARVALIARGNPNWPKPLLNWLNEQADAKVHPLFRNIASRTYWAIQAIAEGHTPSQAFGLVRRGRPRGKPVRSARGVNVYHDKHFCVDEDVIRLTHLLAKDGTPLHVAIYEAASICGNTNKCARDVHLPKYLKALEHDSPLLHDSNLDTGVEIRAISTKYKYKR